MKPQELLAQLTSITPDQLSAMDWNTLYQARESARGNMPVQVQLAPYEHRAFAREAVHESPWLAPSLLVGPPLYAGAKALGFMSEDKQNTTPPSLQQVTQGLTGVGEGLWGALRDYMTSPSRSAGTDAPTLPVGLLESLSK